MTTTEAIERLKRIVVSIQMRMDDHRSLGGASSNIYESCALDDEALALAISALEKQTRKRIIRPAQCGAFVGDIRCRLEAEHEGDHEIAGMRAP